MTYTEAGRTRTVTLRAGEVAEVSAALARYEPARSELDRAAAEGLVVLQGRRSGRRR